MRRILWTMAVVLVGCAVVRADDADAERIRQATERLNAAKAATTQPANLRDELDKLRRENARLRAENETLRRDFAKLQATTKPAAPKGKMAGDEPAIGMTIEQVRVVTKSQGRVESETAGRKIIVFRREQIVAGYVDFEVTFDADGKAIRIERDEHIPALPGR